MTEFFLKIVCLENERYSVIVEDDGRVAYAYLLDKEEIIGDIWLYNQSPTPLETEWVLDEENPFLNPQEFIKENIPPLIEGYENDINLNWKLSYDKESLEEVEVIIRNRLIVKLFPGSCPGYSNFVIKDGPLGKVLI
ncbi:hypothetical protein [Mucilaginibacter agri]|uniref:Uncharacterized protein n=1 Tax=Mucilaginibacter agri TaxID=2695265 RepID=A0A965ZDY1_9SPHI|nr:hypothetical protein [Mucilaginibacter agri]NCD67911.1 hypothetical protein [Mucilaginibacter agri]